jgi:hypothetical protein
LDKEVLSQAQSLRQPIEVSPTLWDRIEDSLREEIAEGLSPVQQLSVKKRLRNIWGFAAAAAALIIVGFLGGYLVMTSRTPSSGLLSQKALARVEQKEQEYIQAIQELEKIALPHMADLNLELNFLFRDRLDTIDAQIKQCREALEFNRANVHMRRHLMIALQEKRETLVEVLNLSQDQLQYQ